MPVAAPPVRLNTSYLNGSCIYSQASNTCSGNVVDSGGCKHVFTINYDTNQLIINYSTQQAYNKDGMLENTPICKGDAGTIEVAAYPYQGVECLTPQPSNAELMLFNQAPDCLVDMNDGVTRIIQDDKNPLLFHVNQRGTRTILLPARCEQGEVQPTSCD